MDNSFKKVISSPIRWAGSKKKLLNEMLEVSFPKKEKNYIEPFLGSGIVLINLLNNADNFSFSEFYVNDINVNIINLYKMIRDKNDLLIKKTKKLESRFNQVSEEEKEKMYYEYRDKFNSANTTQDDKTIYFFFLMKTGFNGVYRENSKGLFNVPFGKKKTICFDYDNLIKISNLIQNVKFYNLDYKLFIDMLERDGKINKSFIYCDPPYLKEDSSTSKVIEIYTKESFNHIEFSKKLNNLNNCKIMVSMAKTKNSDDIYKVNKFHDEKITDIIRTINPNKIFKSSEIAYKNY